MNLDDEGVAKLALGFFKAATKESADDEDILPQVSPRKKFEHM